MNVQELIDELSRVDPFQEVHVVTDKGMVRVEGVVDPPQTKGTVIVPQLRSRAHSRFTAADDLTISSLAALEAPDELIVKAIGRSPASIKKRREKFDF